jgi:predicted nucleotidyltransferase
MTDLDLLALELSVNGRTLRRAAGRGTIEIRRHGERRSEVSVAEAEYLRRHWALLAALVRELRTVPYVRLAVVFGSAARGELREHSDLDVLVRLAGGGLVRRASLLERLEEAGGRAVQLVELDDAVEAPLLLADVLRDGRVLVDRDGDWPRLKRGEQSLRRRSARAERQLSEDVWDGLRKLEIVD